MHDLRNEVGFAAFGVRHSLVGGVEERQFVQRLPVLQQVVEADSHWIDVVFEVVLRDLRPVDFLPLPAVYDDFLRHFDCFGHVEEVGVGFDEPFGALVVG